MSLSKFRAAVNKMGRPNLKGDKRMFSALEEIPASIDDPDIKQESPCTNFVENVALPANIQLTDEGKVLLPSEEIPETIYDSIKEELAAASADIKQEQKKLKVAKPGTSSTSNKLNKTKKIPPHWEEMLANIRVMREAQNAPVDFMGCDQCQDNDAIPKDKRYQVLISLMLSSQTKDQVTYTAMQKLIKHGCTVDSVLNMSDADLGDMINTVGFWKKKVQYIKASTKILKDKYGSDIPKTVEELQMLKGVGPKMAHLCMHTAWGETTGIGVDTHVHRVTNRMAWVKTKTAEATRSQLEDWLPPHLWPETNHLLVGFGQQICLPRKPDCRNCLNNKICQYGMNEMLLD